MDGQINPMYKYGTSKGIPTMRPTICFIKWKFLSNFTKEEHHIKQLQG